MKERFRAAAPRRAERAVLTAGYVVGLLMQANRIDVADLAAAVRQIETLCAGMCAAREDRAEAVVPALVHEWRLELDAVQRERVLRPR